MNNKVAAYLRLSKEEFNNEKESNSIINQRQLIDDYLKEHKEYKLVYYYIDDGYSGTNFDRPEFQGMLEDIKNKKIDIDKENWIVTENHHEAIISKEKFDKVQDILDSQAKVNKDGSIDILSGFLKCKCCGGNMVKRTSRGCENIDLSCFSSKPKKH